MSEKQVLTSKNMITAQAYDRLQLVTPTKANLLESDQKTGPAVHCKPSFDRDTQMSCFNAKEQYGNAKLKHDWKDQVHFWDAGYRKQFLDMLTEFQTLWVGHVEKLNITKTMHRTND